MSRLRALMLLLLFSCVLCPRVCGENQFILPDERSHNVEYYDYERLRYAFFLEKVIFNEADEVCNGKDGKLLEYEDENVAKFIGRALAESAVSFGTLWIGAKFFPDSTEGREGQWKWLESGMPIVSKLNHVTHFPMNETPFWVDRPSNLAREERCVGTDRLLHHRPLIVDLPCTMERPFICVLDEELSRKPRLVEPPVKISGKEFHLFIAQATWHESLELCNNNGMKLAKLTTKDEFVAVSQRMRRSRPIMENAWIGGQYSNGVWTWVTSSERINVNQSEETSEKPFPWYRPDNIIMDGCLLADRHVCDHFVYVEAMCSRRRNFICEKEKYQSMPPFDPVTNTSLIWVSTYEDTWVKAQSACRICIGGRLLELNSTQDGLVEEANLLFTAMALTLKQELRHVWIGGYLYNTTWKWGNDTDNPPEDDKTIGYEEFDNNDSNGEKGSITFAKVDYKQDSFLLSERCLNVDREQQKAFCMYGLACHMKQYFICEATEVVKLDVDCLRLHKNMKIPNTSPST